MTSPFRTGSGLDWDAMLESLGRDHGARASLLAMAAQFSERERFILRAKIAEVVQQRLMKMNMENLVNAAGDIMWNSRLEPEVVKPSGDEP